MRAVWPWVTPFWADFLSSAPLIPSGHDEWQILKSSRKFLTDFEMSDSQRSSEYYSYDYDYENPEPITMGSLLRIIAQMLSPYDLERQDQLFAKLNTTQIQVFTFTLKSC